MNCKSGEAEKTLFLVSLYFFSSGKVAEGGGKPFPTSQALPACGKNIDTRRPH